MDVIFNNIDIIRISQSNCLALLIYFVIIKAASYIPNTTTPTPNTMGQACVEDQYMEYRANW